MMIGLWPSMLSATLALWVAITPAFVRIAEAFPDGAGTCAKGRRAILNGPANHNALQHQRRGSIGDNGYELYIVHPNGDRFRMVEEIHTVVEPNVPYTLEVEQTGWQKYRGFLFRLEDDRGNPFEFINEAAGVQGAGLDTRGAFSIVDPDETKLERSCFLVGGMTHTNANEKETTRGNVTIRGVARSLTLDVTIVVSATYRSGKSEWFYSPFKMRSRPDDLVVPDALPGVTEATNYKIDEGASVVGDDLVRDGPAEYRVTLTNYWTADRHRKDYPPTNRRPHLSTPIYASHNCRYRHWKEGRMASPGFRRVAELGATQTLLNELAEASSKANVLSYFRGLAPSVGDGDFATSTTTICVDEQHPLITFVSMLAPSPDWIMGSNAMSPVKDGRWYDDFLAYVYPWDSGTDSGSTYRSVNSPTDPQQPITAILPVQGGPDAVFVSEVMSETMPQRKVFPVGSIRLEKRPSVSPRCAQDVQRLSRRRRKNILPRVQVRNGNGTVQKRRCDLWVAKKPKARCRKKIAAGKFQGKAVKEVCRAACLCHKGT